VLKYVKGFEQIIVGILMVLMALVVLLAAVDLGLAIVSRLLSSPFGLIEAEGILDIFGYFLIVLIGIELLGTMTAYFVEHVVHSEVVVEVAMIAVARKVIILDVKDLDSTKVIAIAAIIAAMAVAYFVIKRSHRILPKLRTDDHADAAR